MLRSLIVSERPAFVKSRFPRIFARGFEAMSLCAAVTREWVEAARAKAERDAAAGAADAPRILVMALEASATSAKRLAQWTAAARSAPKQIGDVRAGHAEARYWRAAAAATEELAAVVEASAEEALPWYPAQSKADTLAGVRENLAMARAELADKDGEAYRAFIASKGAQIVEETGTPLASDWTPAPRWAPDEL